MIGSVKDGSFKIDCTLIKVTVSLDRKLFEKCSCVYNYINVECLNGQYFMYILFGIK